MTERSTMSTIILQSRLRENYSSAEPSQGEVFELGEDRICWVRGKSRVIRPRRRRGVSSDSTGSPHGQVGGEASQGAVRIGQAAGAGQVMAGFSPAAQASAADVAIAICCSTSRR